MQAIAWGISRPLPNSQIDVGMMNTMRTPQFEKALEYGAFGYFDEIVTPDAARNG